MPRKRTNEPSPLTTFGSLVLASIALSAPTQADPTLTVQGQEASTEQGAEPMAGLSDATPRGAVLHFLEACRAGDYARAGTYLEGRAAGSTSPDTPDELARQLRVVLDRTFWIDLATVSAAPEGTSGDGLDDDMERLATIETSGGPAEILLRRSAGAGGKRQWRIASTTVARIPALYDEFGYGALGEILPEQFFVTTFLEVQLWQWIGMLFLVLAAYALSWVAIAMAYAAIKPVVAKTKTTFDDEMLQLTGKPLRFLAALGIFSSSLALLRLAVPVENFLLGLQKGLAVIAIAWLFLRAVDILMTVLRSRLEKQGKASAIAALPLGEKTIKVVVLGLAFVVMLQSLGFNVTGLIAGLGVGGLAIALAAQKTVENLFGGVSLIMDQPVRVGDFCRYGDKVGTVEDVGLRSTKIRTLERTVVSIPNSTFAYLQLESFAPRDKIRFYTKLGLRYETTPDQMRWVLSEIRSLLLSHPRVDPDPGRIRFVGYGAFSLDMEITAYVTSSDFNEYLAIQEDLLLRIMDIVKESGTGFAFPSSTTYLARDGGNDTERTQRAEARMHELRESGKLPFPDFTPEWKAEAQGTIDYPPKGSALGAHS